MLAPVLYPDQISGLEASSGESPASQRRAFGRGFASFVDWFESQNAPDAGAIWAMFSAQLAAPFVAQSETIWRYGLHPTQRAAVARVFCEVARAKMQLDPSGDMTFDALESRLWSAALAASPRTAAQWQEQQFEIGAGLGANSSIKHRLASLLLRAGRFDTGAARLYIEVFTGRGALPIPRSGARHSVEALLERGAAISPVTPSDQISERYSLCLLLQIRDFRAPWLASSLQTAREKLPATRARLQKRFETIEAPAEVALEVALVTPSAAESVQASEHLSPPVVEDRTATQESPTPIQAAVLKTLPAASESAPEPAKPRRKRGRPRKNLAAPAPISLEKTAPDPKIDPKSAPATASDTKLDFDSIFVDSPADTAFFGAKSPKATRPKKKEAPTEPATGDLSSNESWSNFSFGED